MSLKFQGRFRKNEEAVSDQGFVEGLPRVRLRPPSGLVPIDRFADLKTSSVKQVTRSSIKKPAMMRGLLTIL